MGQTETLDQRRREHALKAESQIARRSAQERNPSNHEVLGFRSYAN
jgi:hypothetical protein